MRAQSSAGRRTCQRARHWSWHAGQPRAAVRAAPRAARAHPVPPLRRRCMEGRDRRRGGARDRALAGRVPARRLRARRPRRAVRAQRRELGGDRPRGARPRPRRRAALRRRQSPTTSRGASATRRRACSSSRTRARGGTGTLCDDGRGAIAADRGAAARPGRRRGHYAGRGLPARAAATRWWRTSCRTSARDHLLHVGHRRASQGRDAVAREHPRQCRAMPADRHGAADDTFLSILPLSHMFERTGGYYLPLSIGAKVAYGRGVAQIADDLPRRRRPRSSRCRASSSASRHASRSRSPIRRSSARCSTPASRAAIASPPALEPCSTGCSCRCCGAGREAGARALRRPHAPRGGRRRRARSGARADVHRPRPADAAGLRHDGGVAGHLGQPRRRQRA